MRPTTLLFLLLFSSHPIFAETTIDLYGGISNTRSTDVNVELLYWTPPKTGSESINGKSGTYGIRSVYWLDNIPLLGLGIDLYSFQADGKTTKIDTTALSFLLMFRYPIDDWQPYMGMGVSMSYSKITISEDSEVGEKISEGWPTEGKDIRFGLARSISSRFSLFAEYRYAITSVDLSHNAIYPSSSTTMNINTTLRSDQYLIGVSYQFEEK